jgi:hypothetical protein
MHSADDATDEVILHLIRESAKSFNSADEFLKYATAESALELSEDHSQTDSSVVDFDIATNQVTLSTIHGAKGREWRSVCLFDTSISTFVDQSHETNIEEERRIFYVGMTRARECLHISYINGKQHPFIGEALLPTQLLGKEENDATVWLSKARPKVLAAQKRLADQNLWIDEIETRISELHSGERIKTLKLQKAEKEYEKDQIGDQIFQLSVREPDNLFDRVFNGGYSAKNIEQRMTILNSRLPTIENQIGKTDLEIHMLENESGNMINSAHSEKTAAIALRDLLLGEYNDLLGEVADVELARDHMPLG